MATYLFWRDIDGERVSCAMDGPENRLEAATKRAAQYFARLELCGLGAIYGPERYGPAKFASESDIDARAEKILPTLQRAAN